ncbi:YdcF family protein [Terrabacter sp. NPDC000476]|uniref:YdcF family protein n=1 Tax=Terrabacter sp. NPDC000476 TaxID=3154258 RepID=UPI00331E11E2
MRVAPAATAALVVVGVGLLGLGAVALRAEPRRWRVGVLLAAGLWALLAAASWAAAPTSLLAPVVLPAVGALLLGLLLAVTGLRVLRPEGRTRLDVAALVLGVAMVGATVAGAALLGSAGAAAGTPRVAAAEVLTLVVLLLPGLPGLSFVSYLLYCLAHRRRRPRPAPTAVVVLGSGLVGGTVPQLLAHRLDAGAAVWRAERERARPGEGPLLVPSGGQGDDEPMAEGVAMTAYLVAKGVPAGSVATEDRATTTEENLLLSREILRARGLADGHVRVVTSGYHVGRAALLTRRLGIDADVSGAPTAWTFVPGAFLREFLGAVTLHPRLHLGALAAWAVATALLAYAVLAR